MSYFDKIEQIQYEGTTSDNPLAFRYYNPDEIILGKRMEDHLRFAACYWHNFCWNGSDMFGIGTFDRPWQTPGEALEQAKRKADVAFEFFHKLNVPFYCFHDVDVISEGNNINEYISNMAAITDVLAKNKKKPTLSYYGEPQTASPILVMVQVQRLTLILMFLHGLRHKFVKQ